MYCEVPLLPVILSSGHRHIPATSRREGSQDSVLDTVCQGAGRPTPIHTPVRRVVREIPQAEFSRDGALVRPSG